MKRTSSTGFTLIEVMVALLIIAVALGGAVKVMGNGARNASLLSQKTFAQWVGLNQLTKTKLKGVWLKTGSSKGTAEMAQQKWEWEQKIIKTEIDTVNRIEVSVYVLPRDSADSSQATVVGFFAKP
ncbi:MAG: type II secretion system minor pseudopilin GspI [Cocleimonas sp.]|nr:type II secretion system minor pseudopilin GspI [Cocleimonas sp.]